MGELHATLRTLDRIYARYGTDPFPVGGRDVAWQDAWELDAFGFAVLHAHPDMRRDGVVSFRAVPDLDTPAPYRLIPVVAPHAPTAWTATLTPEALRLVSRVRHPSPPQPTRRTHSAPERKMMLANRAQASTQPSLDGGSWAPEQAQLDELLWSLESLRAAFPPMPRGSLFGPAPAPYEQLHAPVLTGARIPGWATPDGEVLVAATRAVLQYEAHGPRACGLSAGPNHVAFTVTEQCTVAEVVDDFDLPSDLPWQFTEPGQALGPTARLASSTSAWDLYLYAGGKLVVDGQEASHASAKR